MTSATAFLPGIYLEDVGAVLAIRLPSRCLTTFRENGMKSTAVLVRNRAPMRPIHRRSTGDRA
jgi:hypothetical protein